jgi:RNA-directed DNA polymerase
MARRLTPENRRPAGRQVKANHGAPGREGRTSEAFPACAREPGPSSRQARRDEPSQPSPVRRTEIPKRHGQGKRGWGIPTLVERGSQPAIA